MDEDELFRVITGQSNHVIRVCRLPVEQQRALGADTPVVWLSPETCRKTEVKHHHPQLELYRKAPLILEFGKVFRIDERHLLFVHEFTAHPDKPYRAVVKRTIEGNEIYLVSVSRMRPKQMRRVLLTYSEMG
jgi:hypothetical protein